MKINRLAFIVLILLSLYLLWWFFVKPTNFGPLEESPIVVTKARLEVIGLSLQTIKVDFGDYPDTDVGLNLIFQNTESSENWRGPYLKKRLEFVDYWGNDIVYLYPDGCNKNSDSFILYSQGVNEINECGEGDDIVYGK